MFMLNPVLVQLIAGAVAPEVAETVARVLIVDVVVREGNSAELVELMNRVHVLVEVVDAGVMLQTETGVFRLRCQVVLIAVIVAVALQVMMQTADQEVKGVINVVIS